MLAEINELIMLLEEPRHQHPLMASSKATGRQRRPAGTVPPERRGASKPGELTSRLRMCNGAQTGHYLLYFSTI